MVSILKYEKEEVAECLHSLVNNVETRVLQQTFPSLRSLDSVRTIFTTYYAVKDIHSLGVAMQLPYGWFIHKSVSHFRLSIKPCTWYNVVGRFYFDYGIYNASFFLHYVHDLFFPYEWVQRILAFMTFVCKK